jgi:small-conductance mechanosensitive channel
LQAKGIGPTGSFPGLGARKARNKWRFRRFIHLAPAAAMIFDKDTVVRLAETATVSACAAACFVGVLGFVSARARCGRFPRLAVRPVHLVLRYGILLLAALLAMGCWGFPIDPVMGSLGAVLGLIGIGFVAMWSVLSNVVCTFVLVLFKPFSAVDEIEFTATDNRGTVTDLNLIFTTLAVDGHETILVPNNLFFQQIFRRRAGADTVDLEHQLAQSVRHAAGGPMNVR